MPRRPSQKVIENEKRLQETLDKLLKNQYPFIHTTIKAHNINHITLDHRIKREKFIAETHENHQNLSRMKEKIFL